MSDETPRSRKRNRTNPSAETAGPEVAEVEIAEAATEAEAAAEAAAEVVSGDASTDQGTTPVEATTEPEPTIDRVATGTPVMADASTIRIERGGIDGVRAGTVEVRMGGIGALEADKVRVQWGGVGAAKAERLGVEFGSVGAALAGELHVTQGFAGSVIAREATVEQAIVRTMIAQRVTVTRPTGVLVMIAAKVDGEVRPLLDWRGALAVGLAIGLVSAAAKVLRERR